jgi:hypothetical protein
MLCLNLKCESHDDERLSSNQQLVELANVRCRGGLTTFVLLNLKGRRQQQQALPDSTAAAVAANAVPEPAATGAELQLEVIAATFGK